MEYPHVVILRKNLMYLKEHLEVGDVLDHFYQEGIFTQPEYKRCKEARTDKCSILLEILMMKEGDAYKSLCAVLDTTQPHIEARLDKTSCAEGTTNLLYVNKQKCEHAYKLQITEKEKTILELEEKMNHLRGELTSKEEVLLASRSQNEEDRQKYEADLKNEKKSWASKLEEEIIGRMTLQSAIGDYEKEIKKLKEDKKELEKAFTAEREKYESLTQIKAPFLCIQNKDDKILETEIDGERLEEGSKACVFAIQDICDDNQLMLLPCLHAVCKPCMEQHNDQNQQDSLICPCGQTCRLKAEELSADYVRRNEAAYSLKDGKKQICTYTYHESDIDAQTFCQDCDEYLCQECQNHHNIPKKNKHHKLTDIKTMEALPIQKWLKEQSCTDHSNQKLEFYDNVCQRAICNKCSHGSHQHDHEDLDHVYEQRKETLLDLLSRHKSYLETVRDVGDNLLKHQAELENTADALVSEVISQHESIAGKFLCQMKQLLQNVKLCLEGPQHAVKQKLYDVRSREKKVMSTIDYIQRVIESTRKAELVDLTVALKQKSEEDIKTDLPRDDTRDKNIRLFFWKRKHLEEFIEDFGSVATCLQAGAPLDTEPTLRDLRQKLESLKEIVSQTSQQLGHVSQERDDLTEAIALKDLDISVKSKVIGENEKSLQRVNSCLRQGPAMVLDCGMVNTEKCHLSTQGELVNFPRHKNQNTEMRFRMYNGTRSASPIQITKPFSDLPVAYYWETTTALRMKRLFVKMCLLEMGICREDDLDGDYWICRQRDSLAVTVGTCDTHSPSVCTQVWRDGAQVGTCWTDTMTHTPDTTVVLSYGIVVDVRGCRVGLIDLDRGLVLQMFDVLFTQPVYPMFAVRPLSEEFSIRMSLVSGGDVAMSESKLSLLSQALSNA